MASLTHSQRKSTETPRAKSTGAYSRFPEIAHLDTLIQDGKGDQPQIPLRQPSKRELVFEQKSQAMLERRRQALEALPKMSATQLSRLTQLQIGLPQAKLPPAMKALFVKIGDAYGVSLQEILLPGRSNRTVFKVRRLIALRLRAANMTLPQIGRYMNSHHTSVLYMLRSATEEEKQMVTSQLQKAEEQARRGNAWKQGPIPVPDLSGEWAI